MGDEAYRRRWEYYLFQMEILKAEFLTKLSGDWLEDDVHFQVDKPLIFNSLFL